MTVQVVIDTKTLGLIKALRDRLNDNPTAGMGRPVPRWLPDGEEVVCVEDVAVSLGMDMKTAAIAVLQDRTAPEKLRVEAKDIHSGSGAHTVAVGLGTRRERCRRIMERAHTLRDPDRLKRKKRRRKS